MNTDLASKARRRDDYRRLPPAAQQAVDDATYQVSYMGRDDARRDDGQREAADVSDAACDTVQGHYTLTPGEMDAALEYVGSWAVDIYDTAYCENAR